MLGATLRTTAAIAVTAAVLAPAANAAVLSRLFGSKTWQARCIRRHESSGNPRAVSSTGDYGWFQINYRVWRGQVVSYYAHGRGVWIRLPRSLAAFRRVVFKPTRNAQIAWAISHGGTDWKPWSSYSVHGFCR